MTKIGVVHTNFPDFSFDRFLHFAADTGYEWVELNLSDVWEEGIAHPLSEADAAPQSRHVASFGLQISGIAARRFRAKRRAGPKFSNRANARHRGAGPTSG